MTGVRLEDILSIAATEIGFGSALFGKSRQEEGEMAKIYDVENTVTREYRSVEATSVEDAAKQLGWKVEECYLHRVNVPTPPMKKG